MTAAPELDVTGQVRDGVLRLVAVGDVDIATVHVFRPALLGAARSGHPVELDLSRVEFLDAAGLSVLVAGRREAAAGIRVTGAGGVVRRILELTGLLDPPD